MNSTGTAGRLQASFFAVAALFFSLFLSGCATVSAPGRDASLEHPWIMGEELTRVVVSSYGDGSPSRVEYYREGRRLAVEHFDERGESTIEGRVPDGIVREYYEPGAVRAEVPFRDGLRHGMARYYHREGGIEARVEWVEGRQQGLTRRFRSDGSLMFEEKYEAGAITRRRAYTPGGTLIYEQEF